MRGPIPGFRGHVITALLGVLFAVVFGGSLLHLSGFSSVGRSEYRITALLPSSSALAAQSRVTMAGVPVGRVVGVERVGGVAKAELAIEEEHGPIPADSRVGLRLRTLIGEKSIEVIPGSSATTLPAGGVLPLSQGDELVEVDEILSQLRGRTRARARQSLRRLGAALDGRETQLHGIVDDATTMITRGAPGVRILAKDHENVTRLVSNLGRVAERIGERGNSIEQLATAATTTFKSVATRDRALRATLDELPATLEQVRRSAGVLVRADAGTSPVLRKVTTAVRRIDPTLVQLTPAAADGRRLVREIGRATPPFRSVLRATRKASDPLAKTLPLVRRTLCHINPMVRYVAPYGKELAAVIQGLGSAVNAYDANGHIARLYIGIGDASAMGLQSPEVARALTQLTNVGILHDVRLLGYNPYPEPGKVNDLSVGRGASGPFDAENRYTRVEADC